LVTEASTPQQIKENSKKAVDLLKHTALNFI